MDFGCLGGPGAPGTPLDRPGPPRTSICTNNQSRRPILRPFRVHFLFFRVTMRCCFGPSKAHGWHGGLSKGSIGEGEGENNKKSVMLWLRAIPGGFGAIRKGRGPRPRPFWMAPKPTGTAQSHKVTDFCRYFSPSQSPIDSLEGPPRHP